MHRKRQGSSTVSSKIENSRGSFTAGIARFKIAQIGHFYFALTKIHNFKSNDGLRPHYTVKEGLEKYLNTKSSRRIPV